VPAPAKSAAATAHLATGQYDRDRDIMPVQLWPDRNTPTGPPPSRRNRCQFKELPGAVTPHYGNSVKIKRLDMESGPKEAQIGDWISFSLPHRRHLIAGEYRLDGRLIFVRDQRQDEGARRRSGLEGRKPASARARLWTMTGHNWHSGPQFRVDRNVLISARGEL
jgi:hypothetical protein